MTTMMLLSDEQQRLTETRTDMERVEIKAPDQAVKYPAVIAILSTAHLNVEILSEVWISTPSTISSPVSTTFTTFRICTTCLQLLASQLLLTLAAQCLVKHSG